MKKLYKKGKVHPSPPPTITDHLSLLPATILTLTAALSPEDKEVLAYLISCCGNTSGNVTGHRKTTQKNVDSRGGSGGDHGPMFQCNCFRCYMSFWARWDTSPNRQLIHEIIEEYEEGLFKDKKKKSVKKKERSKRVGDEFKERKEDVLGELDSVDVSCGGGGGGGVEVGGGEDGDVEVEKGSLRKIASFIGDRIWGVWYRD